MRAAVMQPYIFPYLGYFQLIAAVDKFVFYDDVDFIKGGWVNRNKIFINGNENLFTIPLNKASSFKLINETELHPVLYKKWKGKFLKTVKQGYGKAPFFKDIYPFIEKVFQEENKISELAIKSIVRIAEYLNLEKEFFISSRDFKETKDLERTERLISISKSLNATEYINMYGGKELYNKSYFNKQDVELNFLQPVIKEYKQFSNSFIPGLSIIDVLMFNNPDEVMEQLNNYEFIWKN